VGKRERGVNAALDTELTKDKQRGSKEIQKKQKCLLT